MIDVKDNWRILLLVVLCIIAALALFGPLGASGDSPFDDDFELRDVISSATTDADGEFSAGLPAGEYSVEVNEFGYEPYNESVDLEPDEVETVDIDLTPVDRGTIEGEVTADGEPAANVNVEILDEADTAVDSVTTDEDGTFTVDLPTGEYDLVVVDPLYEEFETSVDVETDTTQTVDLELTPVDSGTLDGTVSAAGDPVSDVELEFVDAETGSTITTTTPDEDGTYETALPTGEYVVTVEDLLYEEFEETVDIETDATETVDVELTPVDSGHVGGTVEEDGEALSDIELEFFEEETGEFMTVVTSAPDGSYDVDLPTGTYEVVVDQVPYDDFSESVTVETDDTTTFDVELQSFDSGVIEGTVTADGEPVPDATVEFVDTTDQLADAELYPDPTNLQYGLELSGGARIRGLLVGMTADNAGVTPDNQNEVLLTVSEELGVEPINVQVRVGSDTVELFASEMSQTEFDREYSEADFAEALQAAGLDVDEGDISSGVTGATREEAVETLTDRLDQTGLSGASVSEISGVTGGDFIVAEAPGISLSELRQIASDAGRVQVIAGFPEDLETGEGLETREVLTGDDFASVDRAQPADAEGPDRVPVVLNPDVAESFQDAMNEHGFTGEGIGQCFFDAEEDEGPREGEWCLYTVVDGEYVYGASMSEDLAGTLATNEDWPSDPRFVMQTGSFQEAQQLEINLRAGALPTELDIQSETFISPSLAQLFKPLALLTALIAWLTVCAVVYYWYRDVRVAVPMLATAASEVFLLLGFAAAIGMALDLSHIAGFIAVIGTGLDDLIIMADEILQRKKEVKTGRIFQSRFRKAFWIIGMAAATTIIAMSPLAVLSLGDLRGFAIVTIVGVLIGVSITRPAYGDVLRHLMLDDVKRK